MFERLTEIKNLLERLSAHHEHPQLAQVQQGLRMALQIVQTNYTLLRQAADWLEQIADLLDPTGKSSRSAAQVQQTLFAYLEQIKIISNSKPGLQPFLELSKRPPSAMLLVCSTATICPTYLVPTMTEKVTSAISIDVCYGPLVRKV
jgi:hypothetical protein